MKNREMVDDYFINYLPGRNGECFYVPKGFISKDNFAAGENLVFSYKTEIVYLASAKSGILDTDFSERDENSFPYYFLVDISSITPASGSLSDLESELEKIGVLYNVGKDGSKVPKKITSQGWASVSIPEKLKNKEIEILESLKKGNIFDFKVRKSLKDSPSVRKKRLKLAARKPEKKLVAVYVYDRNPDVVAERLFKAKGVCECCDNSAPFLRKSDHTPYLEVHHKKPLSEGGEDTLENTIALCPNCHRKAHFG